MGNYYLELLFIILIYTTKTSNCRKESGLIPHGWKELEKGIEWNLELIMYISSFIPLGYIDVSNIPLPLAQRTFEVLFPICCYKKC